MALFGKNNGKAEPDSLKPATQVQPKIKKKAINMATLTGFPDLDMGWAVRIQTTADGVFAKGRVPGKRPELLIPYADIKGVALVKWSRSAIAKSVFVILGNQDAVLFEVVGATTGLKSFMKILTPLGIPAIEPEVAERIIDTAAWSRWNECRDSDAQRKRMSRAIEGDTTMLKINKGARMAWFVGSNGVKYTTSLIGCTCPDFKERSVPCKHMYKLAIECEITNLPDPIEE